MPIPKRILVTGSRETKDQGFVDNVLDYVFKIYEIEVILHGQARGIDSLCQNWAQRHGVKEIPFKAYWDKLDEDGAVVKRNRAGKLYNVKAGFQRNQRMLTFGKPNMALVFPGGNGTEDMKQRLISHHSEIEIFLVSPQGELKSQPQNFQSTFDIF